MAIFNLSDKEWLSVSQNNCGATALISGRSPVQGGRWLGGDRQGHSDTTDSQGYTWHTEWFIRIKLNLISIWTLILQPPSEYDSRGAY